MLLPKDGVLPYIRAITQDMLFDILSKVIQVSVTYMMFICLIYSVLTFFDPDIDDKQAI